MQWDWILQHSDCRWAYCKNWSGSVSCCTFSSLWNTDIKIPFIWKVFSPCYVFSKAQLQSFSVALYVYWLYSRYLLNGLEHQHFTDGLIINLQSTINISLKFYILSLMASLKLSFYHRIARVI
jgi:hypothetical protein